MVLAVVPAAGAGRRFGSEIPKQYSMIAGKTVMQWTLDLLGSLPAITVIMVPVAAEDDTARRLSYLYPDKIRFTTGGRERADSVLAGLNALKAEPDDWVLVHDVARPCVPAKDIQRLLAEAGQDAVGGILAQPVRDTLKRAVAGAARIAETVPREAMWQAQTPQLFRFGLLRDALAQALAAGVAVTDEASALEWRGYSPLLVPGSPCNVKITWPEDLILADYLLSQTA